MAKRGPKVIELDWDQVDTLGRIMCTAEEIAEVLKVSYDTLVRRCRRDKNMNIAEYLALKRAAGRASLRRSQYKKATDGNTAMLIWLGKQYLGQSDKMQNDTQLTMKDVHRQLSEIIDKKNELSLVRSN